MGTYPGHAVLYQYVHPRHLKFTVNFWINQHFQYYSDIFCFELKKLSIYSAFPKQILSSEKDQDYEYAGGICQGIDNAIQIYEVREIIII